MAKKRAALIRLREEHLAPHGRTVDPQSEAIGRGAGCARPFEVAGVFWPANDYFDPSFDFVSCSELD